MDFNDWLRETMNKHGLSDLEVQNRTGIDRSLIWHYKQGNKRPSFQNVGLLADLFAKIEGEAEEMGKRQVYFLRLELIYKMYQLLEVQK